jgi:very-short-patch-repair endonuclease
MESEKDVKHSLLKLYVKLIHFDVFIYQRLQSYMVTFVCVETRQIIESEQKGKYHTKYLIMQIAKEMAKEHMPGNGANCQTI